MSLCAAPQLRASRITAQEQVTAVAVCHFAQSLAKSLEFAGSWLVAKDRSMLPTKSRGHFAGVGFLIVGPKRFDLRCGLKGRSAESASSLILGARAIMTNEENAPKP